MKNGIEEITLKKSPNKFWEIDSERRSYTRWISEYGFENKGRAPRMYTSYMRTQAPAIFGDQISKFEGYQLRSLPTPVSTPPSIPIRLYAGCTVLYAYSTTDGNSQNRGCVFLAIESGCCLYALQKSAFDLHP